MYIYKQNAPPHCPRSLAILCFCLSVCLSPTLRYGRTLIAQRPIRGLRNPVGPGKMTSVVEDEPPPDGLPDGWVMEVRRRSSGRTYKVTVSINYFEEGLPPGWVKGVKVKEAGSKIIRSDAVAPDVDYVDVYNIDSVLLLQFYIDPATGHEFRSKIEVSNYLKTGEVHKQVHKPKKRLIADVESMCQEISLPVGAERTEIADCRTRRYLLTGECSKGGGATSEVSAMNCLEGVVSREIKSNRSFTGGQMITASSLALLLMEKQPLMIGTTKQDKDNRQSDSDKKENEGLNFMRRTSKRLADLRAKQDLGKFSQGEKPMRNQDAEENIEDNSEPPVTMIEEQIGYFKTGSGEMKRHFPTTSMGECIEKLETDENCKPRPPMILSDEFTENAEANYKSILEPKLPITLPEECAGSSATAKESDAKQELNTACPFGESWADPCLEFAFKTLAGDISVEADFVIHNYFERHQSNLVPFQNSNGSESSDRCVDKFLQTDDALLQLGLLEDRPAS
ncbi:hypothetical protein Scep_026088 [Stephania cephalantha]|uniref:MBD domain-containing protein n=1 Tax=Stephania cephalantha TaxID=152367 RepID=A0AAP0HQ05_9MAGN